MVKMLQNGDFFTYFGHLSLFIGNFAPLHSLYWKNIKSCTDNAIFQNAKTKSAKRNVFLRV